MAGLVLFSKVPWNGIKAQKGILFECLDIWNNQQPNRGIKKHWNPKFKWLRTKKVVKVDLPNFQEKHEELSQEEKNKRMKERGLLPPRPWTERPIVLSATSAIFEPYVPPEGDGKLSKFSVAGQKQTYEFLEKKSKSMLAIRKIRQYEDEFSPAAFAETAQEIYIKAHESLMDKDEDKLFQYVTERLYPEMKHGTKNVTIRWKFLQSLEPPKVVHARQTNLISKDNIFAQVTVRLHTQQSLAIYDRFGRLMHGSEIIAKDVLEYVVFEKNISNLYGEWRIHDKIVPSWAEPKQPSPITYRFVEPYVEEAVEQKAADETEKQEVDAVQVEGDNDKKQPTLTA